MSGYGGYKSLESNGIGKWIFKRLIRIYVPFIICNIMCAVLYNLFLDGNFSIGEVIKTSLCMKAIYSGSMLWYIQAQVILYIFFCIAFKIHKDIRYSNMMLIILILIYIIMAAFVFKWGIWRYNTVLAFGLGVLYASYYEHKLSLNNRVYGKAVFILPIIVAIYYLYDFYFVTNNIGKKLDTILIMLLFVGVIILFHLQFSFCKNQVRNLLGKVSYEFYLYQLTFVNINIKIWTDNYIAGILFMLIETTLFSIISSKIATVIIKKIV